MSREQVMAALQGDPRMGAAAQQIAQRLQQSGVSAQAAQKLIAVFEFVLKNPQSYAKLRQTLLQQGVPTQILPTQFTPQVILPILGALYLIAAPQPTAFAEGGLAQLASRGRNGDSELAHINPFEAEVLRAMGGSGTVNPATGLAEYGFFDAIGDIFKAAAPVLIPLAVDFFAPGLGSSIAAGFGGGALGAAGAGALMGGVGSALTGGNLGQGALAGALGGGLGGTVGGWANEAMGAGLGAGAQGALGNALVGGAGSMARGQGFMPGAAGGALGSVLGGQISGLAGEGGGSMAQGLREAGSSMGNLMTAGYTPQQALAGGALAGLTRGLTRGLTSPRPSQQAVAEWRETPTGGAQMLASDFQPGEQAINPETGEAYTPVEAAPARAVTPETSGFGLGLNAKTGMALMALGSLGGAPPEVKTAVSTLSPQQQEYFNRPSVMWDWDRMQRDASRQGSSLSSFMASNWPRITGYAQSGGAGSGAYSSPVVRKARGGALGEVAALARGAGSGRADTIDARLSDGEYVMDAETVSLLGDGSTGEGAKRLDKMREHLRAHKGKALAKGKFSPNAKSPLSYLKETA